MENSNNLSLLLNNHSILETKTFISLWNYIVANNLDNYSIIEGAFCCVIQDQILASFDGELFKIHKDIDAESTDFLKQDLIKKGFLNPLIEEVLFYPIDNRIEGPSHILHYNIINSEDEVVKALKSLNLNTPIKAKAIKVNECLYNIKIQINEQDCSLIKIKKIGATSVKCALICLCLGWINLAQAMEDSSSLDFTTEREEQLIKYKKIIDKHIKEGRMEPRVDLYQNQDIQEIQRNNLQNIQRSANRGVMEILNTDYQFEKRLQNKLNDLENKFFNSEADKSSSNSNNKGIQKTIESGEEESSIKIKNKVRLFQGKAQVEAQYADFIKMKVEANAFAGDKIRANVQTRTLELKELGVQVYGQVRYLSSEQTVISEIRSGFGNNLDLSIYNRKTKEKNKPADENVVEMRYQLDF